MKRTRSTCLAGWLNGRLYVRGLAEIALEQSRMYSEVVVICVTRVVWQGDLGTRIPPLGPSAPTTGNNPRNIGFAPSVSHLSITPTHADASAIAAAIKRRVVSLPLL